jgi:pimeloyl-ACP methyl ester carboxylesterase
MFRDDDLIAFQADGPPPLPDGKTGWVENDGAQIWYGAFGSGPPVILLHGGLGNAGNWGHQVPVLVAAGFQAIAIDSRGHGRSTRDARPFSYQLLASDVRAVMARLGIAAAAFVGWSDGACTALVLAAETPGLAAGVVFFGCNMDPGGAKPFVPTPVIDRCFARHVKDYQTLSATPDGFEAFVEAVGLMQRTEPNYSAEDLAAIDVPVLVLQSELDEFIWLEHAQYLAATLPRAELMVLPDVSHFAPVQRPDTFNAAILPFLQRLDGMGQAGLA